MADIKQKSRIKAEGGLNLPNQNINTVPIVDSNKDVISSSVTATELSNLSGTTSAIQTQLNAKLNLSGGTMSGDLDMGGGRIHNISDPSSAADAMTLNYADNNYINQNQLGVANGVATLDGTGKVPSTQLPSYVDDVVEYSSLSAFPVTGETGKIYVALDTNKVYRWSGSVYVEVSPSDVYSVFGRTGAITAQDGDYNAMEILNSPSGNITKTRVQLALNELDSIKQPLDATLTALAAFNSDGILVQTSADNFTSRTITGTASNISVSNGDGVSGNPTIDLVNAGTAGTYGAADHSLTITTDDKGRVTSVVSNLISIVTSQISDFASNVLSTVLTGFSAGPASAVTSSDTVLSGIQKLQGQINALPTAPTEDISLTSFAASQTVTNQNVTGLAFNGATVRSFRALVSVSVSATTPLYEAFELLAVNKGSSWDMAISSTGDDSAVSFTIDNSGQVLYTSGTYVGFTAMKLEFRAIVTQV